MKELRNRLQFSQQQMALLLGVSRSALALYENGHRSLPTHALIKAGELELLSKQKRAKSNRAVTPAKEQDLAQYREVTAQLEQLASNTASDITRTERELARMQELHECLVKRLEVIDLLTVQDTPVFSKQLVEQLKQDTLIAMAACCPARQLLMEHKLLVLKSAKKTALQLCNRKKR
ncbi:helix-turn-helix domain-containing protein [Niabella hirudinis]|uniref:helix-turn-helix domain-containing protein n=1 Tax=Niabella hirudinis TaxID=1285929 RepID=UPI003EB85733